MCVQGLRLSQVSTFQGSLLVPDIAASSVFAVQHCDESWPSGIAPRLGLPW